MKRITLLIILALVFHASFAQNNKASYLNAYNEQLNMLTGTKAISFKRAVFITENAFYNNKLDYQKFCNDISLIGTQLKTMIFQRGIGKYKTAGNWAAFSYMADTIAANGFKPYTYDFDDFMGEKDWSKMFVTKLMKTHGGNCHSLPYLYKILCTEIGAKAYLALAPNHIYIKHQDESGQWTNVELTNPSFPRDQWIIKSMAITVEAIKKNVYMAPLTDKQTIAMTMFDLASGYQALNGYDNFVLNATTTALKYFPNCVPLIQLKANCLMTMINRERKKKRPDTAMILADVASHKRLIAVATELGYKDMPIELYNDWVKSVEQEKQKRGLIKQINN